MQHRKQTITLSDDGILDKLQKLQDLHGIPQRPKMIRKLIEMEYNRNKFQ